MLLNGVDNEDLRKLMNLGSYCKEFIKDIADECLRIKKEHKYNTIGVGTPGLIQDGIVTAVNLPLKGVNLADELKKAGILSLHYARSIGIAIDLRRKDTANETMTANVNRIKEYLAKMILYPRKKADKKAIVKEATEEQLKAPEAKEQNTCKCVVPLPKEEVGYTFAPITKEMKNANVYKTQRTEIKTAQGFYKRMEARKQKLAAKKH